MRLRGGVAAAHRTEQNLLVDLLRQAAEQAPGERGTVVVFLLRMHVGKPRSAPLVLGRAWLIAVRLTFGVVLRGDVDLRLLLPAGKIAAARENDRQQRRRDRYRAPRARRTPKLAATPTSQRHR